MTPDTEAPLNRHGTCVLRDGFDSRRLEGCLPSDEVGNGMRDVRDEKLAQELRTGTQRAGPKPRPLCVPLAQASDRDANPSELERTRSGEVAQVEARIDGTDARLPPI